MILGLGVDLCCIEPIRRSIVRFGKDWLDEVFTEEEQERLVAGDQQAPYAAIGFALKEACSKAIGTGFTKGVRRQDFVISIAGGHCSVDLTGAAKHRAAQLSPSATSYSVHAHFLLTDQWVNALAVLATSDDHLSHLLEHLALP
ncbi:holo-ACP synthase [Parvibaculum sp.]|uniref:holo-ACP synthase n=1 Tax=Parvibaculum sp. TaxID=2024848 RepID=UPI00320E2B98